MPKSQIATGVLAAVGIMFGAWLLLILLAIVQFIVSLLVIKLGGSFLGYSPDSNTVVLSATLLTLATIIGASLKNRMF